MKPVILSFVIVFAAITSMAQSPIDHFNVGPYEVDYNGTGDIRYRLRDNIDLFEYFELQKDTVIVSNTDAESVGSTVQISAKVGTNRFAAKEFALEGLWKKNVSTNLYFNVGLSLSIGHSSFADELTRNMLEVGVPIQIELGKLCRHASSLYGILGITPAGYITMKTEELVNGLITDGDKKSGLLVIPGLEFGGNIPIGHSFLRIGVYGAYKINCTKGDFDVYEQAGRAFMGAKIGVIL